MSLKIYNTLTKKKEEFVPLESHQVKLYACGITASGNAHVGHAYQAIIFDIIRKYMESIGYKVTYVRNYTDVDDKIILRARELGISPTDFANQMMNKIDKELLDLGISKPTIQAKATESIPDIISFIEKLIEKGHAYKTDTGDVFFKVTSYKNYGKLSNRNIEEQYAGVRKDIEPGKLDYRDFALWKNAKDDGIYWESPWGKGRPGWHIECSVMSMKYLGESIDIHGGGRDLIFPHHENEIAQSEALTGKQFSKYWIHNGLIKINGEKMSKSLNNGILLEDLLKRYNPEVIRYALIQNNYKSDLNIVDGLFEQSEKVIYTIYKLFDEIDNLIETVNVDYNSLEYLKIIEEFKTAMDNDFNTSLAISNLFNYIKDINKYLRESNIQKLANIKAAIVNSYKIITLFNQEPKNVIKQIRKQKLTEQNISEEEVEALFNKYNLHRKENNYEKADIIRKQLFDKNISFNNKSWDIHFKTEN